MNIVSHIVYILTEGAPLRDVDLDKNLNVSYTLFAFVLNHI